MEQKQTTAFLRNTAYILVNDVVPKSASDKVCPAWFYCTHTHTQAHIYTSDVCMKQCCSDTLFFHYMGKVVQKRKGKQSLLLQKKSNMKST